MQPWFILVFFGVILLANFARAASRRKRARSDSPYAAAPRPGTVQQARPGTGPQPPQVPAGVTLLNGIPMKGYEAAHGQQAMGFANERMKAEAELKRQLDALDAARRAGQVTADQYAAHREAIFRNF
jgi:hypothetical protein